MTLQGTIKNGVVILENPPPLADGTRVEVVVPGRPEPTLGKLLPLAGKLSDLPPDMAERHDHYIHKTLPQ